MPGKYTEGYTKDAQKAKFVRHRDIKMKDSELKKEAHIQKVMCEGVCKRCREKAQWRFRFDKYKPLKNLANCQHCKQKCVTKAYRTLCDKCGTQKNVCPGCCGPLDIPEESEDIITTENAVEVAATVFRMIPAATKEAALAAEDQEMGVDEGDDEDEQDGDEGEEEEEEKESAERETEEGEEEEVDESMLSRDIQDGPSWNEKKFRNIAASKYSKNRRVGADSDVTYY
jgi:hypothetical protein